MSDATTPGLSIGMPLYNAEPFLEETLQSLLTQTYEDFEVVISDNASTDATGEICQEFCATDKRLRYFRNRENIGAAKNYNRVFELASGKYFKWAAGDDLCAPEFLQKCVEILDRDRNVILCYAKTKIIDENGSTIGTYEDALHLQCYSPSGRFLQLLYNIGECNAVFGVIRSEMLRKTRLIGTYIASDTCLLAELSLLGRFYEIPEYMFFRRHHPRASSANREIEKQLEFFDPNSKGKTVLIKWRHFYENFLSIKRAHIKYSQKVLPAIYLLGSLIVDNRTYMRELKTAFKHLFSQAYKSESTTWQQVKT